MSLELNSCFQTHLPSPARRGSRSRTASPPAPLAIRKAPSASVESIEPRPPRPCEVGRPKGRRRKNRRQSHTFFFSTCCAWHTNSPPRPGEAPHPAPSARKSVIRLHRKLPSVPPASITLNLGVGWAPTCWHIFGFRNLLGVRCTTRCTTLCTARPIAALHFLLPTGDSR